MTLTYWYCQHQTDSDCYSIREKTKKAAKAEIEANIEAHGSDEDFKVELLVKVTVEYDSAFDLMTMLSGEGGNYAEARANNEAVAKQPGYNAVGPQEWA